MGRRSRASLEVRSLQNRKAKGLGGLCLRSLKSNRNKNRKSDDKPTARILT